MCGPKPIRELWEAELLDAVHTGQIDPNWVDQRCDTPLLVAMDLDSPELVEAILDAGADPNLTTPEGQFALNAVIHYCLKHPEIGYRYLESLLAHGANLNSQFDPPLHSACLSGDVGLVQFLLDHGADPDYFDGDDHLPADWVAMSDAPEANKKAILRALAANKSQTEENDT